MATYNKNYSKKLQDPRWQKKRLQILERDNFTCKSCGSSSDSLHVHHHLYEKGKDPWDYSDDIYETYCQRCHAIVEYLKKTIPSVTIVRIIYKDSGDHQLAYTILFDKKKILLAVFNYYHKDYIEILVHIPSAVVQLVSSLINIQKNG